MRDANVVDSDPRPPGSEALVLEAWAQGYMVGSLIIMAFITVANMRRGVILHKLILIELVAGIWQGFWLFFPNTAPQRVDTWWLSVAAIPLNASWILHNVVSWMKIKPFLSRFWSQVFIWSVMASIPYWIIEMYANFAYFHNGPQVFKKTRPLELLFRDPWWIITTIYLFIVIKTQYEMTLREIVRISPRFGVMLAAMVIAIIFVICDVLSVTSAMHLAGDTGINPFWKFAFVFKCLTDSVILDDFKMALDRLRAFKISRLGSFSGDYSDRRSRNDGNLVETWEKAEEEARVQQREQRQPGDVEKALPKLNTDFIYPKFHDYGHSRKTIEQHDSVVAQNNFLYHTDNLDLNPEDIVLSAIEDSPMRSMEAAHLSQKKQHEWLEDVADARHLTAESDYAAALRDLQGPSPPVSPYERTSSRPSKS
ncbi:hypothetical protein P280DRAFT_399486 [Massarina eburnea CBS 473.64]|uniref:Uncharacterized protein n=1 Tax=Massarina eburnea CBS 473.64 TaxID=1395130 RepID=A0A6A6S3T3_9PLEO|nr:hypothetical protein P280DRAFT_399486 [Massarina eburnea CBS 473.64]